MDRFLEESVSKHHRVAEEVLYYASWVVMIVSAILAFMYLNVMFYQLQHLDAGDDAAVHGYCGVHFLFP